MSSNPTSFQNIWYSFSLELRFTLIGFIHFHLNCWHLRANVLNGAENVKDNFVEEINFESKA